MTNPADDKQRRRGAQQSGLFRRIQTWFKICALLLAALILARVLKLQIVLEFDYNGEPFTAALTQLETYYLPLGLVLAYLIFSWIWRRLHGTGKL